MLRGIRSPERGQTERLLQALDWVVVDDQVSRMAGELGRTHRRSRPGIDISDLLIAATALRAGAGLATTNVKRFPMFEGLRAPYDE